MDSEKTYLTISDINHLVKEQIDCNYLFNNVYLKGEISNFKNHTRGHLYFSLKDDNSKISAVMFYNNAIKLNFEPVDGDQVLVNGRISCYEAAGTYQIYINDMQKDGLGNLYLEYEKLKKKLSEKGYFDEAHKKAIPKYPSRIGVVTASTGAAVRDIMSTIKRRYPICEVILFPSLVQGVDAKESIVKQINNAQDYDLDILIVGRGGGSIEDLWAFNEEIVADAIYNSNVPIISAVGHEVDFTIADYVADLRAPTPTGAAEMAVPMLGEVINNISQYQIRLNEVMKNMINNKTLSLTKLVESYVLKNPLALYEIKEQKLDNLIDRANNNLLHQIEIYNNKLNHLVKELKILNPLNILEAGYSLTTKGSAIVKSVKDIKKEDSLTIKVTDGKINVLVKEILNEK
ncbi:MAG: exodeoxyribonuclease VII large subunit [Bacilli bacterium]|nr:exodeoxyribonuclease VII large subunit [Bacilli bacterium]